MNDPDCFSSMATSSMAAAVTHIPLSVKHNTPERGHGSWPHAMQGTQQISAEVQATALKHASPMTNAIMCNAACVRCMTDYCFAQLCAHIVLELSANNAQNVVQNELLFLGQLLAACIPLGS